MKILRAIVAFAIAVVVTTLLGAVLQTQFNLAALQALGAEIPLEVRLHTTARDLAGFTPQFGMLVGVSFLIAFLVTALLRRWIVRHRAALYALAGAVAVLAFLLIMEAVFGLTAIAATRGAAGFTSFLLSGALGGWLFARATAR